MLDGVVMLTLVLVVLDGDAYTGTGVLDGDAYTDTGSAGW